MVQRMACSALDAGEGDVVSDVFENEIFDEAICPSESEDDVMRMTIPLSPFFHP